MTTRAELSTAEDYGHHHTALMRAALDGNTESVKELVHQGADINQSDDNGRTALMFAVINSHYETMKVLLKCGADVNARSSKGGTALMGATLAGDLRMVQALLDKGADLHARLTETNESAVTLAANHAYHEIARLLSTAEDEESTHTNYKKRRSEEMKESTFEGVGGLKIFTRSWQPEGKTRGVVVIVPGFNSHSGQYLWVGEQFAAKDLAAYAIDLRGRGRSEGERYYVEKMEDYTDDVATLVRTAKSENPGLPVFLLGHSAGGVISCVYTLDHQSEIDGLICESFAYDLPAPGIVLSVLKGLSHIAPHTHVYTLKNEDFSRDPRVVDSMNNDPLIKGESEPTQTAKVMIDAASRLNEEFPLIKLPVLILHGTDDKATNPSGSQFFYDTAGSTDKTLKLYEGHYHDLLNDVDKEVVMADIQNWIDARVPAIQAKSLAATNTAAQV